MAELSPHLQVLIAVAHVFQEHGGDPPMRAVTAAAIRAAVDRVISQTPPPCADFDEHAQGFLAAHVKYRTELLAIIAELESSP